MGEAERQKPRWKSGKDKEWGGGVKRGEEQGRGGEKGEEGKWGRRG